MTKIEDRSISYKTALLAKSKGVCFTTFVNTNNCFWLFDKEGILHHNLDEGSFPAPITPAPTQTQLQTWLREVHDIDVFVGVNKGMGGIKIYSCYIKKNNEYIRSKEWSDILYRNDDHNYENSFEQGLYDALELI